MSFFRLVSWHLLLSPSYWLLAIGSGFGFTGIINFYLFLPIYSSTSVGLSRNEVATVLATISGVDLVSRLFFGAIGDVSVFNRRFARPRKVLFASTGIGAGLAMIGEMEDAVCL